MSEQEEYNLQQSQEGEQTSNQSKEVETTETSTVQQEDSPIRPPAYSPTREPSSTYFAESPLESPLLQEHSRSGSSRTAPRHFNPPLPVSPSSLILKKDSKKKRRYFSNHLYLFGVITLIIIKCMSTNVKDIQ